MSKTRQYLLMIVAVSLSSQIYFNLYTDGFIVAMSPFLFCISLYLFKEVSPPVAGLLVGPATTFFRGVVMFYTTRDVGEVLGLVWPDAFYFVSYGILYSLLGLRKQNGYLVSYALMALCDFLSNVTEMTFRTGGLPPQLSVLWGFVVIAALRMALALVVIIGIDFFQSFLARQEHEQRYKKLMVLASVMNSEVYFMSKGMVEIEDVMKKAFLLNRRLEEHGTPEDRALALDIAKDVHEIKKDYLRILTGIQEGFFSDVDTSGLRLRDMLRILNTDVQDMLQQHHPKITYQCLCSIDFYVEHHFSLMSVLRNLIINSIDAIGGGYGKIELRIAADNERGLYLFDVKDNGPGIKEEDMAVVFDPGFSTKFDEATGNIYRGVGLTLVQDLVQDKFDGTITVQSRRGNGSGTTFHIELPQRSFAGEDTA